MKRIFNARNLVIFIFLTFVASMGYVISRIVLAPTVNLSPDITVRVKSDYTLMLLQCAFGLAALFLPTILERTINLRIPSGMLIAYMIFLYCSIYLGEIRNFYYALPHWDTILHTFSGAALGALGFSLISLLNRSESVAISLTPLFVAIFAFCFALALGTVWEIYEFSMDCLLRTNMQKYALETGASLVGQAALMDTMKDLIVDATGALVMSVAGYFSLKRERTWLKRFQLRKK